MKYLQHYLPFVAIVAIYLLSLTGRIDPRPIDYLLAFFIGYLLSVTLSQSAEIQANRIMIQTVHNALQWKGVLHRIDLFNAQNDLVGETYDGDFKKLCRQLSWQGIYLHDYVDTSKIEPSILEEQINMKVTLFDSFTGLVDRFKPDLYHKIKSK